MEKQETMSAGAALRAWLSAESKSFTALCGESFTRWEVIKAAAGTLSILMASILAGGVA